MVTYSTVMVWQQAGSIRITLPGLRSLAQDTLAELQPIVVGELEVLKRKVFEGFVSTSTRW
jgi:hypothetical protein